MTSTVEKPSPPSSLVVSRRTSGDRIFDKMSMGAAGLVLLLLVAIAAFLLWKSWPALKVAGWSFFTEKQWQPDNTPPVFGIAALAFGTLLSSILSLVVAVPVAIGSALLLVEVAPPTIARPVGYLIELLAAVPSVVYGLWGVYVLVPRLIPFEMWLGNNLSFIPFFNNPSGLYGRSMFVAVVILTIMILPIIVSSPWDILRQVPSADREAAMALGATKWETIRLAVLPYARGGLTGSVMLGLGRALGETIAVAMVLSADLRDHPQHPRTGGQHDRGEHRHQVRRGGAAWPGGACGLRPGAVRNHPRCQHDRQVLRRPRRERIGAGMSAGLTKTSRVRRIKSGVMVGLMWIAAIAALVPLVLVIEYTVRRGIAGLTSGFFTHSMQGIGPLDHGGGAYHAIIGTLEQVGIATLISVPIGILVAIDLTEYNRGWFSSAVRYFVDVMTGLPSIVAGLFIFTFWVIGLHRGFSGFAASLALTVIMLPIVVRSTEEMLKLVSDQLRESSLALGRAEVEDHRLCGAPDGQRRDPHRRHARSRPCDG